MGDLYIGSEGQKMKFVFDTGSVWFWLPLTSCQSCVVNRGINEPNISLFDSQSSSSYVRLDDAL